MEICNVTFLEAGNPLGGFEEGLLDGFRADTRLGDVGTCRGLVGSGGVPCHAATL